ncbi:hypothetical protein [Ancylobacter polymorphus]|jgi:hypothetical protein|uniref:DUF4189 domain-containing protein n=1 Tax=Ancylobacter polymorphus TaxID=223390 RepID=A0ABU0BGE3_9HYPH|nr:hypothetical protein [Ancylobacter polymorphus]MDQ0303549.1 hypothetical protein [Ancylobacter polymorphus]
MNAMPRLRLSLLAPSLLALALMLAPGLAQAEENTGIFSVDLSDGYGIDTCIASGASCGQAMADAWCRVHGFTRATSFGVARSDVQASLGEVAAPVRTAACEGSACQGAVAITCAR